MSFNVLSSEILMMMVLPVTSLWSPVSYDGHCRALGDVLGAGGAHCGDQAQPPGAAPGHKHQMALDTRGASASHQALSISPNLISIPARVLLFRESLILNCVLIFAGYESSGEF